jgi:GH24 family phage-related lysozyme (muramidase)
VLTEQEAKQVDEAVKKSKALRVLLEYNANSSIEFLSLPREVQTVIMSVAFQYGSLKKRTPNFFKTITKGDWQKAHSQLLNFGDNYVVRRHKEADYLNKYLMKG